MQVICIITIICISIMGLGFAIAKHGEPKGGNHNFFHSLIAIILVWLLYWGAGLFDPLFN